MNWWRFCAGVAVLAALVAGMQAGCSAESAGGTRTALDDTPRNPEPIDVVSVDGMATLSVPAGAAPAGHTFAISDITESADLVSVGRVYHIQPSGTHFAAPVTLSVTLPVDPEDIWVEMRGEDLTLARHAGDRWLPLETTYDPATGTLSAQITHLSGFGVSPDSSPVPYQVDDHHPSWLWADRWRGHVWTQRIIGEGTYWLLNSPHLYETIVSFFGEEQPVIPTHPTHVIFSGPVTDTQDGIVYWEGESGVRGSMAYSKHQNPAPDHSCEWPTLAATQNLEDPKRSDGFGEFDLEPSRHLLIQLAASLSGGRYYVKAFPADDAVIFGWTRVECLDPDNPYMLADEPTNIDAYWGADTHPDGVALPDTSGFLTDQYSRPAVPPVIMDWDRWTFAPEYDRPAWRAEFLAHLQTRDYHVKRSFWEQIDQKCASGEIEGIACRAAQKTLREYDNTIARWADDCERLQECILQEEVAPLLRNSRIFDGYILAGPQSFCVFVHRLLLSYVPVMPAGSIPVFYHRLPRELQKLYPIAALEALF